MTIYEKFRNSSLDLSVLGLHDGPSVIEGNDHKILAWLIGSPVHFCLIPGQGDMIFAVNPEALPGEQILPVAEDILNFIGLLICCKDAALIAEAYQWSSFRFKALIAGINPGMKTQSVLRALENIYQPPVITDPGAMMTRLRKEHSNSSADAHWSVGFGADFSQPCTKGKCGKELSLNRSLSHKDGNWYVPSVFLCDDGIVVDTYLAVSQGILEDFRNTWGNCCEESLSLGDKLQRQLDDPLTAEVGGILTVNDKPLLCKCSFSALWNPLLDNSARVRSILNHYRLDPDQGYLFKRYCFLRKGKQSQIRTMQLTLEATPVLVPDECFTVQKDGMRFRFTHPGTGLEHSFTAVSTSQEALNPNFLTNHPCFYTKLVYTLEPSIHPDNFRVVDRAPGDYWDGYQDDPAAVIFADRKPDRGRYALSSLHYEPQSRVQWQIIIRKKLHKDLELKLLP